MSVQQFVLMHMRFNVPKQNIWNLSSIVVENAHVAFLLLWNRSVVVIRLLVCRAADNVYVMIYLVEFSTVMNDRNDLIP